MSVRKMGKSWWVDFRYNYERYRIRSPDNSRVGALNYESTLRHRLTRGEPLLPTSKRDVPTFEQFASEWFETYVKTNNKPSEVRTKRRTLDRYLLPAFGSLELASISSQHIERYKSERLKSGLQPKTVNNHLTILRKCLACAVEWGHRDRLPPIHWLRHMPPPIRAMSSEFCERLLSAADNDRDRAMLLLALTAGLRVGEVIGLQKEDVSFGDGVIAVQHNLVEGVLGTPKSNRIRYVPLAEELAALLKMLPSMQRGADIGFVFRAEGNRPLSRDQANWILWRACKKASIPRIGWHRLRHSVGTLLHHRGAPLRDIQELLGHSTSRMTERYTHVTPQNLRDVVELLPWCARAQHFGQQVVKEPSVGPDSAKERTAAEA